MTCAKRRVVCIIVADDGRVIGKGENFCHNPQSACPRGPGEDYTKCTEICKQDGHAEQVALRNALVDNFHDLKGSLAYIFGHTHVCDACADLLIMAGIRAAIVVPGANLSLPEPTTEYVGHA